MNKNIIKKLLKQYQIMTGFPIRIDLNRFNNEIIKISTLIENDRPLATSSSQQHRARCNL